MNLDPTVSARLASRQARIYTVSVTPSRVVIDSRFLLLKYISMLVQGISTLHPRTLIWAPNEMVQHIKPFAYKPGDLSLISRLHIKVDREN